MFLLSLPMRGAWIEIKLVKEQIEQVKRRSPCGGRGLKSFMNREKNYERESLPMRGAWIEISLVTV